MPINKVIELPECYVMFDLQKQIYLSLQERDIVVYNKIHNRFYIHLPNLYKVTPAYILNFFKMYSIGKV